MKGLVDPPQQAKPLESHSTAKLMLKINGLDCLIGSAAVMHRLRAWMSLFDDNIGEEEAGYREVDHNDKARYEWWPLCNFGEGYQ